jgi:hypothetical protein
MAADQIFVIVLVLACAIAVGWMSINSHKAETQRSTHDTPLESGPPGTDPSRDDHA